jgi:hypothetical protein
MLTKITKIQWASVEDQLGNQQFNDDRSAKILEMVSADKTDGLPIAVTDVITERYWLDEPAAQEFIDFILLKVQMYNLNLISTQILDAP